MRKSSLLLPRYVDAATANEGDTIRIAWKVGDVEHTRSGVVARIVDQGSHKLFVSPDGNEIARMNFGASKLRVTLLAESKQVQHATLFEMENMQ